MGQSSLFNLEEGRRPGTEEPLQSHIDKINEERRKISDGLPEMVKGLFARANVRPEAEWKVIQPEAFKIGVTHFFDTNKTALERFDYQTALGNLQPEWKGLPNYDGSQKNLGTIDADFLLNQRKGKKGENPLPTLPPPRKPSIGRLEDAAAGASGQRQPPVQERRVFGTAREAAVAALQAINARSIREDREYAGRVCRQSDGAFIYTAPRPGTRDSSNHGNCPANTTVAAGYHTHGAPAPHNAESPFERFSVMDIRTANWDGVAEYMSAPSGGIRVYDPATERAIPRGNPRDASNAGHFIRERAPTR